VIQKPQSKEKELPKEKSRRDTKLEPRRERTSTTEKRIISIPNKQNIAKRRNDPVVRLTPEQPQKTPAKA
jgi:hypothetical protein